MRTSEYPAKNPIVDMHGKPLTSGLNNQYLASGLSNGAASLTSPSLDGWSWWGGSSDDDITEHLDTVRQRCRDLVLNAPVVAGMINTINTNVVGPGLIPEPTPDAKTLGMTDEQADQWKSNVLQLWEAFAESKDADIRRRDNFYEIQQLVHRSVLESGDVFVALPHLDSPGRRSLVNLRIQVIEADCVCNPDKSEYDKLGIDSDNEDIFGGVGVGLSGEIIAYYVAVKHPLEKRNTLPKSRNYTKQAWQRIPVYGEETGRRNMLHIMRSLRPGQRRGVPALSPIVENVKILDRFIKAELQAALVQALFTAAVKTEMPDRAIGEWSPCANSDPRQEFYEQHGMIQMGAGTIGFLAPGDDIVPVGVTHPSSGFGPFVDHILKTIGAALGLPFEMVVMMFSTTFSASRAAMNMFNANVRVQRDWLIYDFCQPVWEAFLENMVACGYVEAPGFFSDPLMRRAYCMAKWAGPADLQIDPKAEADGYAAALGLGAMTYSDIAAKYGADFAQNVVQLAREQGMIDNNKWDRTPLRTSDSRETEGNLDAEDEA